MKQRFFDIEDYENQVKYFIEKSITKNHVIPCDKLRFEGLPDARWFIKNCPDSNVNSWNAFVDWCGFYAKGYTSKEKVIQLIYKKANALNRPLMYDDFRDIGCYEVPMTCILKFWGTMNKMKKELGLDIIQEDMTKKNINKEQLDKILLEIKEYVIDNNLPYITQREINTGIFNIKTACLERWCKRFYNKTLGEKLKELGLHISDPGRGYVYHFNDGEITLSQFEYIWSNILRQNELKYNIDYKRNIPYSDFINSYNGFMDCDYVIYYNNRTIYIEIPGVIEAYKQWYYADKPINSKSKEKYKNKLKQKEKMLKENNCEYYLLFPCDLTTDNLTKILIGNKNNLRREIEQYHKHNIKWSVILQKEK